MSFLIVDDPLIKFVFDLDGHERSVKEYNNLTRAEFSKMRNRAYLETDKPQIRCSVCYKPVWPKLYLNRERFFFSHKGDKSKIVCYLQEKKQNPKYIDARRYNGQKEGADHKKIKALLKASIEADPNFAREINVEKNWYNADETQWRRPDIAATYISNGTSPLKIAFEIQLSSTFLKVMGERQNFYLNDNALLFWVFKEVKESPRQYQDDLFYNNNYNLFVIDEETLEESLKRKKLTFRCFYSKPTLIDAKEKEVWQKPKLVSFDDLDRDIQNQKVYFFDYEGELSRLKLEIALANIESEKEQLREKYINFANQLSAIDASYLKGPYLELQKSFSKIGISLPERIPTGLAAFNRLVFSAKTGEPKMTNFNTLLEVANCGFEYGKPFMWYFGQVLKIYKSSWELLIKQAQRAALRNKLKSRDSWQKKAEIIRQGYTGAFKPDRDYEELFYFLFPEISKPDSA